MTIQRPRVRGVVHALAALGLCCIIGLSPVGSHAQTGPDTLLVLQKPENVQVWRTYDPAMNQFVVYLSWADSPDSLTSFIHRPDTTGWHVELPFDSVTTPSSRGWYSGNIDRTVAFRARQEPSRVGVGSAPIDFYLAAET